MYPNAVRAYQIDRGCVNEMQYQLWRGRPTMTADEILRALTGLGLRRTRPRRLIAEQLERHAQNEALFTTDGLYADLQRRDPQIGRATVFRAVEALTRCRLLDRVEFADGTRRYRVASDTHCHYVTCLSCQRVAKVGVCLPDELFIQATRETGYTIEWHALELFGRCPYCRRRGIQ